MSSRQRDVAALLTLLRRLLARHRGRLGALLVLQAGQTFATLWLPTLTAELIDRGVLLDDRTYIARDGIVMVVVALVQVVLAIATVGLGVRIACEVARDARSAVFRKVVALSSREVSAYGVATLVTRTTNDVQQVQQFLVMTLTMVIAAPLTCAGAIVLAVRLDAQLSAVILVTIPVLVAVIRWNTRRMLPLSTQVQAALDRITLVLREQISGVRVVRAFVLDDAERTRFSSANARMTGLSTSVGRLISLMFPVLMLIVNVAGAAVVWIGAHRIAAGSMQAGTLTAFLTYLLQIFAAIMMTTFLFMQGPRSAVSAGRIEDVLGRASTVPEPGSEFGVEVEVDDVAQPTRGVLELRGVGFAHPGARDPVLRDVALVARPGETTAIVGSTGSGKSTLVALIARLADPTSGSVHLDGADLRSLSRRSLSAAIAVVPQRPYLFAGTVATNLRYGDPGATDGQLWQALSVAQADGFVRDLPGGLDGPISQGGTNVSGGQRQRLAIARAVLTRAAVYVFDDSFSALDHLTDAAVRTALAAQLGTAAFVIVAQRIGTIRHADRIIVLDEGLVVGAGTHEQLLADCPTYQQIAASQLSGSPAR